MVTKEMMVEWLIDQLDTATEQGGNPLDADVMVEEEAVFVQDISLQHETIIIAKLSNGQQFKFLVLEKPNG